MKLEIYWLSSTLESHNFSFRNSTGNMESHANKPLKIVLLGDEGVGKTGMLFFLLILRLFERFNKNIESFLGSGKILIS